MKNLREYLIESLEEFDNYVEATGGKLPDSIVVLGRDAKNNGPIMDYMRNDKGMPDGTVKGMEKLHDKYPEILDNIIAYISVGPKITLVYNSPIKKDKNKFPMITMATNYAIIDGRLKNIFDEEDLEKRIKKLCK